MMSREGRDGIDGEVREYQRQDQNCTERCNICFYDVHLFEQTSLERIHRITHDRKKLGVMIIEVTVYLNNSISLLRRISIRSAI